MLDFTKRRFDQNPFNYTVFLLLTDGIINDLPQTIDEIVKGCYLPLSIIIVGIGNEDFKKMEVLDADDIPLISSWGEQMKRDIVQFVPFKKFKNNPMVLREEVLDEVPHQVKSFYKMKGIKPNPMQILNPIQLDIKRGNTITNKNLYKDLYQEENPDGNYPSFHN